MRFITFFIAIHLTGLYSCTAQNRIDKNKQALLTVFPIELHDNIPYMQVSVANSKPVWFIVDCGASLSVVDKTFVDSLKLRKVGSIQGTGAGSGTYEINYLYNVNYQNGKLNFVSDSSYCIDLSKVKSPPNRKLLGLLGYDFFNKYVVSFDYDKKLMKLYDAKKYKYSGNGETIPIVFKKQVPYIKANIWIPGVAAAFDRDWLVDTGSGDTFNDDLLKESTGEKKQLGGGNGLGNSFQVWQAKSDSLQIGSFKFKNMFGVSGGMKIGGGVLKYFRTIFVYQENKMILEPQETNFGKK